MGRVLDPRDLMRYRVFSTFVFVLIAVLTASLRADQTPAPPDWQDGGSVYLGLARETQKNPILDSQPSIAGPSQSPSTNVAMMQSLDSTDQQRSVEQTAHESPVQESSATSRRHLAPPSTSPGQLNASAGGQHRRIAEFGLPTETVYTMVTALTIVVGSFLLFAWAMRRGTRRSSGTLPSEVVSVLGRVSLTARQHAQLLRVGNKLVLVSLTPSGADTITEVTDQTEVDRIMGLCQEKDPHSTTKAFAQVFNQLSDEPRRGGFLGNDEMPTHLSPVAGAYRAQRGDKVRV